jgi:hypothetical protein
MVGELIDNRLSSPGAPVMKAGIRGVHAIQIATLH